MSLDINIVSARGVVTEVGSKLYVVVSITGAAANEHKARTHVDSGGGNPTWNFAVKFAVHVDGLKQELKTRLVFALKCEDGRGERELGDIHVSVAELFAGNGNSLRYVAVSYPVTNPSGQTVGVLNFEYKFGGSPASEALAAGFATRNTDVYPPQGYQYPPPPPAAAHGIYPPPPLAAAYGIYPPPPSHPYPPPSQSHYPPSPSPSPYPPYNAGPSPAPPYNLGPSATPPPYPPYNLGPSPAAPPPYSPYNLGPSPAAPPPYSPYNLGPSPAPPYANPYPQHPPSHVYARAQPPMVQRSTARKKKSVWGSALGVAGAVAVGVLSGVAGSSLEFPSVPEIPLELPPAPEISDLTGGFQMPVDPTAFAPTDFSFMNTFDPQAFMDATYVDFSSLAPS